MSSCPSRQQRFLLRYG